MPKSKPHNKPVETLPESLGSLEEFGAFWDTHSSADYEDFMEETSLTSQVEQSRTFVAVEKETAKRARQQARRRGISTESLINRWLREKAGRAPARK
jgi:predicted HicB family RNase H-like nuclease